jgi:PAT family beta-lactamase induction signal transducer AmpG
VSLRRNLLDTRNGRLLTFGLLYVSEGIPYGFTSAAMVAFMRQQGLSLEALGMFSAALFMPWAFKWAWAPLIDLIRLDRWGGRRAWIVACTTMMLLSLLLVASIDAEQHFQWLLVAVIVHNFFCATQDVAIDSLAVSVLRADERARGNGFMFGGQYLGIMLGGGAAVFVSGFAGFRGALTYVGALCLLNLAFVLLFVHDPEARPMARRQPNVTRAVVAQLVMFVKGRCTRASGSPGQGPSSVLHLPCCPAGRWHLPTRSWPPFRWTTVWPPRRSRSSRFPTPLRRRPAAWLAASSPIASVSSVRWRPRTQ